MNRRRKSWGTPARNSAKGGILHKKVDEQEEVVVGFPLVISIRVCAAKD